MRPPSTALTAITAAVLLGTGVLPSSATADVLARRKEVAQRGAEVMPFSLSATTHFFTKTSDGGIQQVVTRYHDPKQTALIREHLSVIARQFSAGDFEAPEQIHGDAMPGLASLRAARPGELQIRYRDLPNGGEIAYHASDPRLVEALHEWFDAQLSDHGHDAMAGHEPGMMPPPTSDSSAQK